jgi:hypothetical protein
MRTFELKPGVRSHVPLLVGIVGASGTGKTFSALRLAVGIQRVVGGKIGVIDTEHMRATHYCDRFKFEHLDFKPPFGPLDYLAAIEHCVSQNCKIVVVDSMTHEHSGEGGVLDQIEQFLERLDGDKRDRNLMRATIKPKAQRKKLNNAIVQLGINGIFCYRAVEKIKPVPGQQPKNLGWMPETTSTLHYDMIQRFLLTPGCNGVPQLVPQTDEEKRIAKQPEQFKDFFRPNEQLSEDLGERMARWAAGEALNQPSKTTPAKPAGKPNPKLAALLEQYTAVKSVDDFEAAEQVREMEWSAFKPDEQRKAKTASKETKKRLAENPMPDPFNEPGDTQSTSLFDNRSEVPH